jgi:hypothetical protein
MSAVIRYNHNTRCTNQRTGHIAIHRAFRPPEEFSPDQPRGGPHTCSMPFQACFRSMARLWYNHISVAGAMSVTLSNAEKQARYRERHLGVDGEKVRVGLNLNAGTRAKMGRLARHRGYTITALVEELVESEERRVRAKLSGKALRAYLERE